MEQQQRIRVTFRKGKRVRYTSHLDVLRYWERALRRAELPLAYSQGFTPHPKIAFAGPLPLGFVSSAEVMDVTLDRRVDIRQFEERLREQTTDDLGILGVEEVAASGAAPQALTRLARYRVELPDVPYAEAQVVVDAFLERESLPWVEQRGEKTREYDLREAVVELEVTRLDGGVALSMLLANTQDLTGRPEQVVAALFPHAEPALYERTELILADDSKARNAWRRRGRYQ